MLRALYILVLLFILARLTPASAEEPCPEVRLDQTPALQSIPRWDQENSFLCYAFSAAVLIDFHRIQSSGKQEYFTSPLALAGNTVAYSQNQSRLSSFFAGRIDQSIEVARERGVCGAGFLSDRFGEIGLKELLPPLQAEWAKHKTQSLDAYLAERISSRCEQRVQVQLPQFHSEHRFTSKANRLSEILASGAPLAAEFCSEVVTNPRFSAGYGSMCGRHYAVIVGQRQVNNRCEILVRDSQCSQYKTKAGTTGCNDSHYWIDRKAFLSNTQSLHWLQ